MRSDREYETAEEKKKKEGKKGGEESAKKCINHTNTKTV